MGCIVSLRTSNSVSYHAEKKTLTRQPRQRLSLFGSPKPFLSFRKRKERNGVGITFPLFLPLRGLLVPVIRDHHAAVRLGADGER